MAVDGRVQLAHTGRQPRRFKERYPAEGVDQQSVAERHLPRATRKKLVAQSYRVSNNQRQDDQQRKNQQQ